MSDFKGDSDGLVGDLELVWIQESGALPRDAVGVRTWAWMLHTNDVSEWDKRPVAIQSNHKLSYFYTASGSIPTFLRAWFCWSLLIWLQICLWKHPFSLLHNESAITAWKWDEPTKPGMHQSLLSKSPAGLTVSPFKSVIKSLALLRRAPKEGGWEFKTIRDVKNMVERMGMWEAQQYLLIWASQGLSF